MIMWDKAKRLFQEMQSLADSCLTFIDKEGLYVDSFYDGFGKIANRINDYHIDLTAGATKGVIISKDVNFVFKIPFFEDDCGTEFNYDYCDLEVFNYNKAKKNQLNQFFSRTAYFDTIKTEGGSRIPVYIQSKAIAFEDLYLYDEDDRILDKYYDRTVDKCPTKYLSQKANSYTGTYRLPLLWINDFIEIYGEDNFDNLGEFLDKYGINDLHRGNIGYDEDAFPIIFDFSGFHDYTDDSWNY